jgi:magnesium-transporting ATPase (P-type)
MLDSFRPTFSPHHVFDENACSPQVPFSPASDGLSYGPDRSSACTLYGGTAVAQARAPKGQAALAMVVRTRFYSAKGQLLRWGMAVLLFV